MDSVGVSHDEKPLIKLIENGHNFIIMKRETKSINGNNDEIIIERNECQKCQFFNKISQRASPNWVSWLKRPLYPILQKYRVTVYPAMLLQG